MRNRDITIYEINWYDKKNKLHVTTVKAYSLKEAELKVKMRYPQAAFQRYNKNYWIQRELGHAKWMAEKAKIQANA